MAKLVLVLGGTKSGKSAFAESLVRGGRYGDGRKYKEVAYIATAEIKDSEMLERILEHRERRPKEWQTIEAPLELKEAIIGLKDKDIDAIIIDCITLYITNLLLYNRSDYLGEKTPDCPSANGGWRGFKKGKDIVKDIERLCAVCKDIDADVIMVSNEVGLSIVPENRLARIFSDIAGLTNQIIANTADEVYFVTAGIPNRIK